jgi:hypothetical protein
MEMFEVEFEKFLQQQRESASGQRLEMLNRDLSSTKKLMEVVVWPVLKSFEGVILEYEIVSSTGVKVYIDVFYEPLGIAFECEGFVVHAEKITRDRFDFEKMRVRTMGIYGFKYTPFSRDQLDKQPDTCRRSFYELLGRYSSIAGSKAMDELTVYEREVIRYVLRLMRPFRLSDVKFCLQCGYERAHNVIICLQNKKLIKPLGNTDQRVHQYEIFLLAREYML